MNTVSRVRNDASNMRLKLDQLQLIDNQHLLDRENEYTSPTLLSGYNNLFNEPDSDSSRESSEEGEEAEQLTGDMAIADDDDDEYSADNDTSSQQASQEEDSDNFLADDDPSEECSADSFPEPRLSRYAGHPLGVQELEMQEEAVRREKAEIQERYYNELRQKQQWSLGDSRVRAKILVSEAYFKEKAHIMEQVSHIDEWEALGKSPRPMRRFQANHKYRDPGFNVCSMEVLSDVWRHKKVVQERLVTLEEKWSMLGKQVSNDMAYRDNFQAVIRNLSVMRIFLEGQQSMNYSPSASADSAERHRRYMNYQNVIHTVMQRNDGYFLKDALPRGDCV
eukprot:TRINITY_DN363_c4_g1_i1.p1 TRINITY_DN363_c4_g1~~TRINITY_DN363_c4_g1_i1.p1  ORF type:complete len:336 (+),score=116.59 TRINITY_DN363_c4_g1_i1:165-1172(+)